LNLPVFVLNAQKKSKIQLTTKKFSITPHNS